MEPTGLRERKRRRTRRALVDAALRLFDERGYEATTIADITAAADVSTRTFFGYFRSKEDLLFADTDERLELMWATISDRQPGEGPLDVLRRVAVDVLPRTADELMAVHRSERAGPHLGARSAERLAAAQQEVVRQLVAAFPDELSEEQAVAVTGALVAVAVHSMGVGDSFERLGEKLQWTLDLMGTSLDSYALP